MGKQLGIQKIFHLRITFRLQGTEKSRFFLLFVESNFTLGCFFFSYFHPHPRMHSPLLHTQPEKRVQKNSRTQPRGGKSSTHFFFPLRTTSLFRNGGKIFHTHSVPRGRFSHFFPEPAGWQFESGLQKSG